MTDKQARNQIRKISKEKSRLIKKLEKSGIPNAYGVAGQTINLKYGKFWREQLEMFLDVVDTKMSYY